MTEAEWLAEQENPYGMVNHLREHVTSRKARLFACACYRYPKLILQDLDLHFLALAERSADGLVPSDEIEAAEMEAVESSNVAWAIMARDWWTAVEAARSAGEWEKEAIQCDLVRCIFGNPFRPVAFNPAWRTDTAVALARQMYESHDFGAMPILADALQDAGCEDVQVLSHCREAGPHARGCWVVDGVLGKV